MKTILQCLLVGLASFIGVHQAAAQGTAFTYQGRLNNNGNPANGVYDFQFSLSNAPSGGSQIGGTVTSLAVGVTNGLFTTTIDFGAGVFTGSSNWLAIAVRTNGGGSYVGLNPLQQVTPTPYAIYAPNAGAAASAGTAGSVSGPVAATQLTGTLSSSQLGGAYSNPVTLLNGANSFGGNGGGLTNINLSGVGPAGTFTVLPLYFGPQQNIIPYLTDWIVMADVNGDGKPDLIVRTNVPTPPYYAGFIVLTNAGNGVFIPASTNIDSNTAVYAIQKPVVADFNKDGIMDIAILDIANVIVYKGNGDGTFVPASTNNAPGTSLGGLAAADLNPPIYNGYPSIIYWSENTLLGTYTPLYNHADGSFGFSLGVTVTISNSINSRIGLSDINGDGLPDLIYTGGAGLVVMTNHNGLFTAVYTNSAGLPANNWVLGDVNGDGKPDVVTANPNNNNIVIFTNAGGGIFVSNATVTVGKTPVTVVAITNNTGLVTYLATANGQDQTVTVLANDGHGNFTPAGTANMGIPAASRDDLVTADLNGDGNPDFLLANDPGSNGGDIVEAFTYSQVVSVTNPITLSSGANIISGYFNGNGSALSNLNASQITSGTLGIGQMPTNVAYVNSNQTFSGVNTFNSAKNVFLGSFIGSATVSSFGGRASDLTDLTAANLVGALPAISGASLTNLNASQLTSGTVPLAALPGAVVTNNASGVTLSGAFNGNGTGLTNLNAAKLTGALPAISGASLTGLNASQLTSGTVPLTALPGAVVTNNASGVTLSGTFSGTGTGLTSLTAPNLTGALPAISGASLTNLSAAQLASGTVPSARLGGTYSSAVTFNNTGNSFVGSMQVGGTGTTFTQVEAGQATMPTSSSNEATNFLVAYPQPFSSTPKVVVTIAFGIQGASDVYAINVSSNSTTAFRVNVMRLDTTSGGWGQNLIINWQAWQ